jgi:hypothetical protein
VDPVADDPEVTTWLAAEIGAEPEQVAAELEEGARRRSFVVDELIEAGLEGAPLLGGVVRLTGLSLEDAEALVRARARPRG